MPREQINYADLATPDKDAIILDDATVEVSWLAAPEDIPEAVGHVQVGLEVDVTYAAFVTKSPNGRSDRRTLLWSPVLTRAEINHMIRTLKRARDAAYGADE